jgi:hypothetical protein
MRVQLNSDDRSRLVLLAAFEEAEGDLRDGHFTDYLAEELPSLTDDLKREAGAWRERS